jgi:transcriptional regulator with XRE-family HTH domain
MNKFAGNCGTVTVMSADTFTPVLAANVTRYRTRLGWTQRDLLGALRDVGQERTQPWLSRVERGESAVTVNDAAHLALALGVSVPALLTPPEDTPETRRLWDWLNSVAPLTDHTPVQASVWRDNLR